MNENLNTSQQAHLKSFQDLPVEFISDLTSKYIKDTLDWINFLDLSLKDCKSICDAFRKSWRNKALEDYLKKMWVSIYVHPNFPDNMSYILDFEDLVFMEATCETFLKNEFTSNNNKRYLRPFLVNWKNSVLLQIEDWKYFLLEFSLLTKLNWWVELEYGVLKNNIWFADIIDFKRKHIHEVSWSHPVTVNSVLRLTVSYDPKVYIEFDWERLGVPKEIKDIYPIIWSWKLALSKSPTFH